MRHYNERFLTVGLTAQQFLLLNELTDGLKKASELAHCSGLDPATVTHLVDQLARKRLVKRQINRLDRRSVTVELTRSGRQLLTKIVRLADDYHLALTGQLGRQKVKILTTTLQKIQAMLQ